MHTETDPLSLEKMDRTQWLNEVESERQSSTITLEETKLLKVKDAEALRQIQDNV